MLNFNHIAEFLHFSISRPFNVLPLSHSSQSRMLFIIFWLHVQNLQTVSLLPIQLIPSLHCYLTILIIHFIHTSFSISTYEIDLSCLYIKSASHLSSQQQIPYIWLPILLKTLATNFPFKKSKNLIPNSYAFPRFTI